MKPSVDSESLWLNSGSPPKRYPTLSEDMEVDIAIVGAGITGLTAAFSLASAGLRVVVLEGREIAAGVSGHTSAHLTEVLDCRYKTLVEDFGIEKAQLVAASSKLAIDEIERHISEEGIACDFHRVRGYLYTEGQDNTELEAELDAVRKVGIDASLTRSVPLPRARTGIVFPNQAELNPTEYLRGLAGVLDGWGVPIFERTHVGAITEGVPHSLVTDEGATVKARTVVFATHTPLSRFILQTKLARYQSYVIAFAPHSPAAPGLYWDTADPYHYTRTVTVGSSTLLIVGGEDHKTGEREQAANAFARLDGYAIERYSPSSIDYRWSAQVIESVDGLPFIGREPMSDEVYVSTGYSGNGLTFGTLGGLIISDSILGIANPYAELYAPSRIKPLASAKDFVLENIDVPVHLAASAIRLARAPAPSTVMAGDAEIVKHDGKLVALYRDPSGCPHAVSAICPHMACVVEWNVAASTWDCPCHGSRFDLDGKVLTGPAKTDLAKIDDIDTEAGSELADVGLLELDLA